MRNQNGMVFILERLLAGMGAENREVLITYLANNALLLVLVGLMLLDVVTGFIAAAIHKDIDSSFSFAGMLKKAQMLLMVAAGMLFEFIYPDIPWGKLIAGLMCLSEMISIVENAGRAGVPLPEQLKETLRRLRSEKETQMGSAAKVEVQVNAPGAKEVRVHDSKVTLNPTPPEESDEK